MQLNKSFPDNSMDSFKANDNNTNEIILPSKDQESKRSESYVQVNRLDEDRKRNLLYHFDIFAFLPVPKTDAVSTKKSLFGSCVLIIIFLAYTTYTLYLFISNNPPRLNQFQTPLGSKNYTLPNVAIAFVNGDKLNTTVNDPSIFTITMDQVTDGQQIDKTYTSIALQPCTNNQLTWMKEIKRDLLCPVIQPNLFALMNTSPYFQYVRIVVNLCDPSKYVCETNQTKINQLLGGGRIFMYLEQSGSVNLASFERNDQYNFQTYQLFLVQGLYNRAEIVLQDTNYIIYPDFFTSFQTRVKSTLSASGNTNLYVSNVTVFNKRSLFQVWFRMDSQIVHIEAIYFTIIDKIASCGALWGVLFALFAFFFLQYNQKKFYNRHPAWKVFDQTLDGLNDKKNIE